LNGLKSKLAERNKKDKARLLAFKKKLDSSATQLDQWDGIYLETQIKKSDYSIDENIVKEYFPSDFTIRGMLDIYSKLFGVRFEQILNPQAWNGDVSLYKMMDQKSKNLIGYIYMDLFPRPNKYGHAAAFTLVSGRNKADGTYNVPISAIVANLNPPTADKPSLLSHDEVETMFHEFGHIMHQTLTRAPYVDLTGMKMAWDFVEAPSQMLENWVWNKGILTKLSGHYTDTRKKFPQKLLNQMLAAKDFNKGYSYTRQLWLGLMDFTFHTRSGPIDVTETANQLYREINGSEPLPGNHFPATFGHLMGGYDSGYYGYLWSEVFAQDMFTRFEGQNILSPKVGARYRKLVLEPGNTKPAMDLLVDFLGRKPNNRAFFKKLKIN
jgi:thimet oligopeptidase